MALKAIVDTLESFDEPLAALYKQVDEENSKLKGKFVLDVEPVVTDEFNFALEDVQGLRTSLGASRREIDGLKRQMKNFDGLDPEKARDALAKMEKFSQLDPEKEADKLAQAKFDSLRDQLIGEYEPKISERDTTIAAQNKLIDRLSIDNEVRSAVKDAKGKLPLERLVRDFVRTVRKDGAVSIEVVDDHGNPRFNTKGDPMTVAELVRALRTNPDYAGLFESQAKSGTGSDPSATGGAPSKRRSE